MTPIGSSTPAPRAAAAAISLAVMSAIVSVNSAPTVMRPSLLSDSDPALHAIEVLQQRGGIILQDNASAIQDDRAVAQPQRILGTLLDQRDREAVLAAQRLQRRLDLLHDHRREPLERLVQQQQARIGHQR